MSGVLGLIATFAVRLASTITVGNDGGTRKGFSAPGVATGPGFGAMSPVTFNDSGGTSRTVGALYWRSTASEVVLAFPSGSPPDNDTTFKKLTIGSSIYLRAARSTYGAWAGPGVAWSWVSTPDPFGAAGSVPVRIE